MTQNKLGCADPNFAGGCCRSFWELSFVKYNQIVLFSTWLVILVPVDLACSPVLLIITLLKTKNRKVIPVHQSMLK